MLGNAYEFYRDCCGHFVVKREATAIKLMPGAGGVQNQNQTMQHMMGQGAKDPFSFGKLYNNTFIYYCTCCICPSWSGTEVELNNERVVETRTPKCFPWCGPYPVTDKGENSIGELAPHCYICILPYGCQLWSWFTACCAYLEVRNQNMANIYNIHRNICTCCCCTKWTISDPTGNKKGEIRQTGWFCPNYEYEIPADHENHRKMVLSAISYLP